MSALSSHYFDYSLSTERPERLNAGQLLTGGQLEPNEWRHLALLLA